MTDATALLRVELGSIEVVLLQCRTIWKDVVCFRYRILAFLAIERMHEIDERLLAKSLKQRIVALERQLLPSHARDFFLVSCRLKSFHLYGEHPDTVRIAFLRVLAKQLLSDTDSKHRILQVGNYFVKTTLTKVSHRMTGLPCPGKMTRSEVISSSGSSVQSGSMPSRLTAFMTLKMLPALYFTIETFISFDV